MPRRAKIDYLSHQGKQRTHTLTDGQRVVLGAASSADIRLAAGSKIEPNHCELSIDGGKCLLRDLTGGVYPFKLAGKPHEELLVVQNVEVEIGTAIVRVRVTFDEAVPAVPVAGAAAATETISTAARSNRPRAGTRDSRGKDSSPAGGDATAVWSPPAPQMLENQVVTFEIEGKDFEAQQTPLEPLYSAACFLLVNTLMVGREPAELGLNNLLGPAVQPYVPGNSLSFADFRTLSVVPVQLRQLLEKGAGVVLYPTEAYRDLDVFLKTWGIFVGWCLQSSALDASLRGGSPDFVAGFFQTLQAILLFSPNDRVWTLMTRRPEVRDFAGLMQLLAPVAETRPVDTPAKLS